MAEFKSYKNKVIDFGIRSDVFKNDSGEEIAYKQTILRVRIDGEIEDVLLSGKNATNPKQLSLTLRGAEKAVEEGSILDD